MKRKIRIGLFHTTIRGDEKLLMEAAARRGIALTVIDSREYLFDPAVRRYPFDAVLERCVSTVKGMHTLEFFASLGIGTVNSLSTAQVCENKFTTSLALVSHRIPTPKFALAFDESRAIAAVAALDGYPVVLKPVSGSWGRLVAKVTDQDALEALLEQKLGLGSPHHHAFYLQEYIEKPGRDIRVTVVGDRVVCAIYRETPHWITNTARGAQPKPCPVDTRLEKISLAAARAVGGGVLGIDVFETKDGYMVNEVNHTMEFKNVQRVTGIDIAGLILDHCVSVARRQS